MEHYVITEQNDEWTEYLLPFNTGSEGGLFGLKIGHEWNANPGTNPEPGVTWDGEAWFDFFHINENLIVNGTFDRGEDSWHDIGSAYSIVSSDRVNNNIISGGVPVNSALKIMGEAGSKLNSNEILLRRESNYRIIFYQKGDGNYQVNLHAPSHYGSIPVDVAAIPTTQNDKWTKYEAIFSTAGIQGQNPGSKYTELQTKTTGTVTEAYIDNFMLFLYKAPVLGDRDDPMTIVITEKTAVKASDIDIDGIRDESYGSNYFNVATPKVSPNGVSTSADAAAAKVWTAWNEEALYFYAEVNDKTPHPGDTFEIFLDWENSKGGTIGGINGTGDGWNNTPGSPTVYYQVAIPADGQNIGGLTLLGEGWDGFIRNNPLNGYDYKVETVPIDGNWENGYIVEIIIPIPEGVVLTDGKQIGIDFQVADGGDSNGKMFLGKTPYNDLQWAIPASCTGILILGGVPTDPGESTDKTELQKLYDTYAKVVNYNYTNASWTVFTSAMTSAAAVLADANTTQDEIDNAWAVLRNAYNKLETITHWVDPGPTQPDNPNDNNTNTGTNPDTNTNNNQPVVDPVVVPAEEPLLKKPEIEVTVSNGAAVANAKPDFVNELVNKAKNENEADVTIAIPHTGYSNSVELNLIVETVKNIARDNMSLTVQSDMATISFDVNALATITRGKANNNTVKIIVAETPTNELNADQQAIVGNNPVIDFSVWIGNTQVHDFNGDVTVTIPYNPPVELSKEDYDLLTVYYIDDGGEIREMKGAKYNPITNEITFTTDHFSKFFISEWINPFTDVSNNDWFYKSVRYVYGDSLMMGVGNDNFAPISKMTRAMLVTILFRNEGEPKTEVNTIFDDVRGGQWYTDAIAWASESGIVTGYGNGLFGTNNNITREQLVVMLYNYAKNTGYDILKSADMSSYTDADKVSAWASNAMSWAVAEGLITGRTQTTLVPGDAVTRAEAAAILMRYNESIR